MATYLDKSWTRRELLSYVGQMEQLAGIKAIELADGTSRHVRVFEVYTGSGLTFSVLEDRALDISACHFQGTSITWASSTGDVHPAYYEAEGLGWLRSFPGGLVATCGLDQIGAPSVDEGEAFGIHGRIGNLPAQQVSYRTYWEADEYYLEISGQVRQTRLFGENLRLYRCITTRLGSSQITVKDRVVNEGFKQQPHMLLYHCNFGFPLISEETTINVPAQNTEARDDEAAKGINSWHLCQRPTPAYQEQVFLHRPTADENGTVNIDLRNPRLNYDLRLTYEQSSLPYLYQWKMMGQGAYVVGLEPANCAGIRGRADARSRDALPMLEPGESRDYVLQFDVIER